MIGGCRFLSLKSQPSVSYNYTFFSIHSFSSPSYMASFLHLLLFTLITFSFSNGQTMGRPTALHFPVRKDPRTRQYYTTLQMSTNTTFVNVVIDLGGQLTWFNCENYNSPSYSPVQCDTQLCQNIGFFGCMGCNGPARPGCTNNTCGSNSYNPYRGLLTGDGYYMDQITTISTDGRSLLRPYTFFSFPFGCVSPISLRNLARQTTGMVGLTRAYSTLRNQLSLAFNLPNKFALCLPSSSVNGVGDIFIGGGPYFMPPVVGDISRSLTSTPLLINPVSTAPVYSQGDASDEYFIGVRSIRIDGTAVSLNRTLLSIGRDGNGGTKLSTIERYTLLHNSIYRAFARAYVSAAASKNMRRVGPVRPFGVCFSGRANGSVPYVDLVLQSENVRWRFNEANLMVRVNSTVTCLGIRDGGLNPRTAVVIGGLQLENYLLEFDLVSSNLKFSSSLLQMNTSCSHNRGT